MFSETMSELREQILGKARPAFGDGSTDFCRKQDDEDFHYEVSLQAKQIVTEKGIVLLYQYGCGEDMYIRRILKVPCERTFPEGEARPAHAQFHERTELKEFDISVAEEYGVPLSMDGAIRITQKTIGIAGHEMSRAIDDETSSEALPAREAKSSAAKRPVPEKESVVLSPSTPADKSEEGDAPKASTTKVKGSVVDMGVRTVQPEGRRPYEAFSVTLLTRSGERVFMGSDLEEKCKAAGVACGDVIFLKKEVHKFQREDRNGRMQSRVKNIYEVEKLN